MKPGHYSVANCNFVRFCIADILDNRQHFESYLSKQCIHQPVSHDHIVFMLIKVMDCFKLTTDQVLGFD